MSASKHAVNEKQLFHGTNPEIVEAICKQNFDWRLHGKNATKYGEGSYFALNSSYSDAYATEDASSSKFMFVAKVLVGSYTVGQSSYRRPPEKDPGNPASDLYDSCVDDRWSPTIFVVFDTDQFYPEYIIEYSAVSRGYQQPATRAPVPRFRRVQVAASQSQSSRTHTSSKPTSHYASGSSSGLGTSALSSGSTAAAAGYSYASSVPSYSTSTSSGPYSYSSGATNASYHSTGSASAYTGGSNLYSSSSSSTYTSRSSSSNPPTRSTSPTGTSAYSSPSSYTGMSSPYSSSASSSYSSKPRNSYPSTTETRQKSSKEPKCLVM